ncbi:MAG: hypothetical protein M1819_004888 [Sarea resinae]|nr:MAG: hypothetical protein M1819_004888 [Sarea resinae]
MDSIECLDEEADRILLSHFRHGMLTSQAARLIHQAAAELEHLGTWSGEKIRHWIEAEKAAVSSKNRLPQVSALADALAWAASNPDPDPQNPEEFYRWPEANEDHSLDDHLQLAERFPTAMASTLTPYYPPLSGPDQHATNSSAEQHYEDAGIYGDMARAMTAGSSTFGNAERLRRPDDQIDEDDQLVLDELEAFDNANGNAAGGGLGGLNGIGHQPPGNDHFAGLLQAVTTAAGQEAAEHLPNETSNVQNASPIRRSNRRVEAGEHMSQLQRAGTKRKRISDERNIQASSQEEPGANIHLADAPPFMTTTRKRRRPNPYPAAVEGNRFGENVDRGSVDRNTQLEEEDHSTIEIRELPSQVAMSDARAVGVHSAAALFRRPSASSVKYTRPPMSKLFTSLELSPENFLHLQAAAKIYMLDSSHPERQNCVGNRGKGDTDMVKLRLYNCVKAFLELEGIGEKFFGKDADHEGAAPRRLVWPDHRHDIIGLITPLLRRMVTNERQRQYAIESRRGGSVKRRRTEEVETDERTPSARSESRPQDVAGSRDDQDSHQVRSLSSGTSQMRADTPNDAAPQNGTRPQIKHNGDLATFPPGGAEALFASQCKDGARKVEDPVNARRIANLGVISGLSPPDWEQLLNTVGDHLCVDHCEDTIDRGSGCDYDCFQEWLLDEDPMPTSFLDRGFIDKSHWRTGGVIPKDEKLAFARHVLWDLFHAIKLDLVNSDLKVNKPRDNPRWNRGKPEVSNPYTPSYPPDIDCRADSNPNAGANHRSAPSAVSHSRYFYQLIPHAPHLETVPETLSRVLRTVFPPSNSYDRHKIPSQPLPLVFRDMVLHVNAVDKQGVRIMPRVENCAAECLDFPSLRQTVLSCLPESLRQAGGSSADTANRIDRSDADVTADTPPIAAATTITSPSGHDPSASSAYSSPYTPPQFTIHVLLPSTGLYEVHNTGEWLVALLDARRVSWMDGEVKVVASLDM